VWAFAVLGVAHCQDPVLLGNLTSRAHEVAGVVYLLSESVIEIEVRESILLSCNFHLCILCCLQNGSGHLPFFPLPESGIYL
jgi:hypothetical protein